MNRLNLKGIYLLFLAVILAQEAHASHALSGLAGLLPLLVVIGVLSITHVLAIIINVFLKRRKLFLFNLIMCILVSAILLYGVYPLELLNLSSFLWYFPIACAFLALGRPKKSPIKHHSAST